MGARGRDLEGSPAFHLSPHVRKIRTRHRRPGSGHLRTWERRLTPEMRDESRECRRGYDLEISYQSGLRPILEGYEDFLQSQLSREIGGGERTSHRAQGAGQGELTEGDGVFERTFGEHPCRDEEGDRHGKIEGGSVLSQRGGGEIDGDPLVRKAQLGGAQSGLHSIPRLLNGRIPQADDREVWEPLRQLHFYVDGMSVDSDDGRADGGREHAQEESNIAANPGESEIGGSSPVFVRPTSGDRTDSARGQGLAGADVEVLQWVQGCSPETDLEVKVGAGGAPGASHEPEDDARVHLGARLHHDLR